MKMTYHGRRPQNLKIRISQQPMDLRFFRNLCTKESKLYENIKERQPPIKDDLKDHMKEYCHSPTQPYINWD